MAQAEDRRAGCRFVSRRKPFLQDDFIAHRFAKTAWAFAATAPSDAQMIAEMARAAERRLGNYNVQHLASTAWSLAKVFCLAVVCCLYGGSILPSYGAVNQYAMGTAFENGLTFFGRFSILAWFKEEFEFCRLHDSMKRALTQYTVRAERAAKRTE